MSRPNYLTIPKNFSSLTKAERQKVAQVKSQYYKKYNKPMPVRYLAPNTMQIVKSGNAYKQPRSEVKCVDGQVNQAAGSVLATTNTNVGIIPINTIQPGTGSWNRIGKKIKMKSIRWRFTASNLLSGATGTFNNTLRVVLVYDRQSSSGAVPTFDTIFGSTDQNGTEATNTIFAPLRIDNTERFTVLKDDVYTSDNQTNSTLSEWETHVDQFVPLKNLDTVFSGQSNPCTIADISSGALYLIFRADANSASIGGQFVISSSNVRLRYYD